MDKLTQNLSQYAAYHLSRKNVLTHLVGIPLIIASIILLLARLHWNMFGFNVSLAHVFIWVSCLYYLKLDIWLGVVLFSVFMLIYSIVSPLAVASLGVWLASAIGLFVIGWIFQFIGHYYEKMKPAFFDDVKGLLIGPLFVAAEVLFKFGYKPKVHQAIIERAVQLRREMTRI